MKCYLTLYFFSNWKSVCFPYSCGNTTETHTLRGEVTSDWIRKHIMRNSSLIPEWKNCHSFMNALLIKHTHVRPHMADNLKIHPDLNLKVKIPNGFNSFTLCGYLEQVSANMVMTIFKTSSCGRGSTINGLCAQAGNVETCQFSIFFAKSCQMQRIGRYGNELMEDHEPECGPFNKPCGTHICNCCKSLHNSVH